MSDLSAVENFEPSLETKAIWRFTRKSPAQFAGIVLPGLFQTSYVTIDTAGFILVLALEAWGLGNLLVVGELNAVYVVFLFLVDVVFAVLRHLWQGRVCEARNRLVIEDDPDQQARLRSQIGRWRAYAHICSVPILLVAAFKVASFYALQGGQFNGLTAGIIVSYFVAAILHLSVTGFFLTNLVFQALLWRDRRSFLAADNRPAPHEVTHARRASIHTRVALREAVAHPHRIAPDTEVCSLPEGERPYVLETWGILMDSQLHALIQQQRDPHARAVVARSGVEHQLEVLRTDLAAGQAAESRLSRRIQVVGRTQ